MSKFNQNEADQLMQAKAELHWLAQLLECDLALVESAWKARQSDGEGYHRYRISKGNGRFRQIAAPTPALKKVQRLILDRLFSQVIPSPFAHGFITGRSIFTHAKVHAPTAQSILTLDLLDAFPSVTEQRIAESINWRVGPLIKFELPMLSSTQRASLLRSITKICAVGNSLPQGAPTSGFLLNLVCSRLDRLMFQMISDSLLPQVRYSRYADDLVISSSARIPYEFKAHALRTVKEAGFKTNLKKIELYHDEQKALVICGLRIQQGELSLPRQRLRSYRAFFDQMSKQSADKLSVEQRQKVLGTLSFLRMIYPRCPALLSRSINQLIHRFGDQLLSKTSQPSSLLPYNRL